MDLRVSGTSRLNLLARDMTLYSHLDPHQGEQTRRCSCNRDAQDYELVRNPRSSLDLASKTVLSYQAFGREHYQSPCRQQLFQHNYNHQHPFEYTGRLYFLVQLHLCSNLQDDDQKNHQHCTYSCIFLENNGILKIIVQL